MDIDRIITEIDMNIGALQRARAELVGMQNVTKQPVTQAISKKRVISPEGKKRIAEGMKRRWATRRAAAKKTAKKQPSAKPTSTKST